MLNLSTIKEQIKVLNKAYPAPKGGQYELTIAFLFGLFIACFLIYFEPFDLNIARYPNKKLTISFFGVISFGVIAVFIVLIPKLFPSLFTDEIWRVKHHIVYYLIVLFFIATLNGLYINYINDYLFRWSNYWWIITRTYALGIIPISLLVMIDYNRRLSANLKQASYLNSTTDLHEQFPKVMLQLEKKQTVILDDQSFLYIQADGNYLLLYQLKDEKVQKKLFRASLNEVMKQVNQSFVQRCHRSYIVNLKNISHVSGNAQGLKLELRGTETVIPVARSYISKIESYYATQ